MKHPKKIYFIVNSENCPVTSPYKSKDRLLDDYPIEEGETLVEIQKGTPDYNELLKMAI